MKPPHILAILAAVMLPACSHIVITPGQGAALAGQTFDQWQAMKRQNQTAAKVAVDVQPAAEPEPPQESPGWLTGIQGAAMMLGLWK